MSDQFGQQQPSFNCWPSESGNGCYVNIEYKLQEDKLELNDVVITIPLPAGVGAPVIGDIDGDYTTTVGGIYLSGLCLLLTPKTRVEVWSLALLDIPMISSPSVSFVSKKNYYNLQVAKVTQVDGNSPVRFSIETSFLVDKYEIL